MFWKIGNMEIWVKPLKSTCNEIHILVKLLSSCLQLHKNELLLSYISKISATFFKQFFKFHLFSSFKFPEQLFPRTHILLQHLYILMTRFLRFAIITRLTMNINFGVKSMHAKHFTHSQTYNINRTKDLPKYQGHSFSFIHIL